MSGIMIKGGTKTREGSEIEERIDFIGGTLSFRAAERTATLALSLLSKDMDEGLELFFDESGIQRSLIESRISATYLTAQTGQRPTK